MMYYIGVDIGGTNVRTIIVDDQRILLKIVSTTIKQGSEDALVRQIMDMIDKGLAQLGISKDDIYGIGTSSAGPFVENGTRIWTPNISGRGNNWKDVPYLAPLKEHFGIDKRYELANDCVSSVKAEQLFGAGRGYSNLVYITISTGIGGGIIDNNHLLEGKSKNAGHFGHLLVWKDGPLCGCGQHGCIEAIASGDSIARRAQELGMKGPNDQEITAKDVFALYNAHDPQAVELIQETLEYLGMMASNIISVTDPEVIIMGGSVVVHNKDIILPFLREYIVDHSFKAIAKGVEFKLSELKDFVGDLAGLSLIFPENVIQEWQRLEPWKTNIEIISL